MLKKILIFSLTITTIASLSAAKKKHHNTRRPRRPINIEQYSYYSDDESSHDIDNNSHASRQTRIEFTDSYSDDEDELNFIHNRQPPMRHQSSYTSNHESSNKSKKKEFNPERSNRSFNNSRQSYEENGRRNTSHNTSRSHQFRPNTHNVNNNDFNFEDEFENINRSNNFNPNRPHGQPHNRRNNTGQHNGINILDLLRFSRMKGWPIIAGLMIAHEYYPTATNIGVAIASVIGLVFLAKKMKIKQWLEKTEKEINKNIHSIICSLKNVYPNVAQRQPIKSITEVEKSRQAHQACMIN